MPDTTPETMKLWEETAVIKEAAMTALELAADLAESFGRMKKALKAIKNKTTQEAK